MNISIALATYNGARWLREQLDSLAGQTLLPCELVVSDDHSTDRTVDVVREFAVTSPFPVRIVPNDIRRGFADNFINALRQCTGDAVAYCDQDDVWCPSKLERCAVPMRSDPNITLVHHDCEEVSADLRPLGIIVRPNGSTTLISRRECRVIDLPCLGCCMLVHRSVVDAVLKYWPEEHLKYVISTGLRGDLGHDIVTLHMASILGTVTYLPDLLIQHRRHQQNTWSADLTTFLSPNLPEFARRVTTLKENARSRTIIGSMYRAMAARAEASGDRLVADHLKRVAHRDLTWARFFAARAELYGSGSRLARLTHFWQMLRSGLYGSVGGTLVWMRSAFKDLAFAFVGPTAPRILETVRSKLHLNFHPQEVIK